LKKSWLNFGKNESGTLCEDIAYFVGQVVNLRRIVNAPARDPQRAALSRTLKPPEAD
jgi:hypothetical protein